MVDYSRLPLLDTITTADMLIIGSTANGYLGKAPVNLFVSTFVDETTITNQVKTWQFIKALVLQGNTVYYNARQAIPPDETNPININWNKGDTVTVGSALYIAVEAAISYTDTQMLALMALAETLTL